MSNKNYTIHNGTNIYSKNVTIDNVTFDRYPTIPDVNFNYILMFKGGAFDRSVLVIDEITHPNTTGTTRQINRQLNIVINGFINDTEGSVFGIEIMGAIYEVSSYKGKTVKGIEYCVMNLVCVKDIDNKRIEKIQKVFMKFESGLLANGVFCLRINANINVYSIFQKFEVKSYLRTGKGSKKFISNFSYKRQKLVMRFIDEFVYDMVVV